MNGKDFFELLGDLDEDIVEDAWTEESNEVTIIEERSPLNFLKIAAAAAACIAVMTAGVYGFFKMRPADVSIPAESGSSFSESSDIESENSEEISDAESSITDEDIKFTVLESYGEYAPHIELVRNAPGFSVQKTDSYNFAVFNVEETNATWDKPVYIMICCSNFLGFDYIGPTSEKIIITGPGKYVVRYDEKYPAFSMSYIRVETCGKMYGDGGYSELDGLIMRGQWIP